MEASTVALSLQSPSMLGVEKVGVGRGLLPSHHSLKLQVPWRRPGGSLSLGNPTQSGLVVTKGRSGLGLACSCKAAGYNEASCFPLVCCASCLGVSRIPFRFVSSIASDNFHASIDEAFMCKKKAEEITPHINGRCIFLVGMMGCGKTTVGKILSEALGYSFFDSDKLVEQAVGGTCVAQIFKEHSEAFFRDNESKVLQELSSMHQLVVATGGGAVIRPINWRHMKKGITVWLDVPLEALARRITAVGTASRPLLHQESGDAYTKAFLRLTTLSKERGEAYANSDVRVSLEYLAAKQGHGDVLALTPTVIATEAIERIDAFLMEKTLSEEVRISRDD